MKAQDKDLKYSLSPSFSFPEWGHSKATISNYSLCRRHNILSCVILIMIRISRMSTFIFCPAFELKCIQLCLFGTIKLILCGLSRSTYPQTVTNRLSPRGKLIYFEKKSQTDSKVKKRLEVDAIVDCGCPPVSVWVHISVSALSIRPYDLTQICHFNQLPFAPALFLLYTFLLLYSDMCHSGIDYTLWATR